MAAGKDCEKPAFLLSKSPVFVPEIDALALAEPEFSSYVRSQLAKTNPVASHLHFPEMASPSSFHYAPIATSRLPQPKYRQMMSPRTAR
jgi:hypothetical protein